MNENFHISTNRSDMDVEFIHYFLSEESYWATGRSRELVEKSMAHSICFGLFEGKKQIGFARVATDYVVFAWLMDLFIDPAYRGQGLGEQLVHAIVDHPDLKEVNGIGLRTEDAQGLYSKFGFTDIKNPDTWMFRKNK